MILLFAGTSDSRQLAIRLLKAGTGLLAAVVTPEAAARLNQEKIDAVVGRLDATAMRRLIRKKCVRMIVDASAPFAELVSQTAMEAARREGIGYCRYERPVLPRPRNSRFYSAAGYAEAAETAAALGGRVLLTTGVKTLELFTRKLLATAGIELFVRFLPRPENMHQALRLGIRKENIVAMQGPFSADFEQALYANYRIQTVVTKEGGEAGSLHSKLAAAESLAIQLVIIERPVIDYENLFNDMDGLVAHVRENLMSDKALP